MILASSDEGDVVLDPFCGSGAALRVCQQLNRYGIGIEINEEYVAMTKNRLSQPFAGFDSIDERMERLPNDLNDSDTRSEYINNHIKWFLNNHPNRIEKFLASVNEKYSKKITQSSIEDFM
ncbi:MAG: site-specific DNA-methyltransferase [Deferribacteraceae bacterium]|jgi:adenine specific DNA methylase Mod|nr:site-specific DNA-methyltransferase [Deferribacteraceae bacterium]